MGKTVVETKTNTSTKTSTESDGTVVEVITTTITDKFSDGSSGTRTETKTIRKAGGGGGGGVGGKQSRMLNPSLTPATSTSPKVENITDKGFIKECLETHNKLRAWHGAPPLVLDEDLGKIAQAWARELSKMGKMMHNDTGFGENVYWNTDMPAGSRPAEAWYSEIKDYNFKKLEGQKGTGHFTQLIWKSSKYVGIALESGKNGFYVVANYFPPGNVVGRFPDNIQKRK